jgi:hypothetical protein
MTPNPLIRIEIRRVRRQVEQDGSSAGGIQTGLRTHHWETSVANDEKLLSLFEPDLHVIVRGMGEEVEFGNLLFWANRATG